MNTFTWYGVCDAPQRPGRALKLEEFPGAGDYCRRRTESTKRFFDFFTVAIRGCYSGGRRPADCKQEKRFSYSLLFSRQLNLFES